MWQRLGSWARRTIATFRASLISVSDPRLLEYFGWGQPNHSGVAVTEDSVLAIAAVYRACSLISATIAMLPMRTIRDINGVSRQRVSSFLDTPGGPNGPTPFEWCETVLWHLLLHGNAFLAHVYGGAGQLIALAPLHPSCVHIELPHESDEVQPVGGKWFDVTLIDGTRERFDGSTMTQILGPSLDGIRGMSVIEVGRNALGTSLAGDRAAAAMFGSGLTVTGIVTPDEDDPDWTDSNAIGAQVNDALTGNANAGRIAVLNKKLKFEKMTMSAEDAQFLESRQFGIEEIARLFGVPPFLLMQMDKQSSWAASIEGQQRGLGRTVLAPWATRIEQRLSRLLPSPRFVEFDFKGLERPDPATEIGLLMQQTGGKPILTQNEARAILNLPPVDGGNTLNGEAPAATPAEQAETDPSTLEAEPANA